MLMKWEDLEIGDIIELNEEFKTMYPNYTWMRGIKGEIIVKGIIYRENHMGLIINCPFADAVGIRYDGSFLGLRNDNLKIPVFKVIKLGEE